NMASQPLQLSANGPVTAASAGGSITLEVAQPTTVGTLAGNVETSVHPQGAGTTGGHVFIQSGGNLKVDSNGLGTNPTANAAINSQITLNSGKNLFVTNWSSTTSGTTGTVTLVSNSTIPFTIGASPMTNGLVTSTALQASTFSITNSSTG